MQNCALEEKLKLKATTSIEGVIEYALYETLPPIEDFSFAIQIIKDYYTKYNDVRLAILGSFLMSQWECYKENDFIPILTSFIEKASQGEKAIIYYLKAYDMYTHNRIEIAKEEYIALLEKSIKYCDKFVYSYYYLSEALDGDRAKTMMQKALNNVEVVYDEESCKQLDITHFFLYNEFVNEHILGTKITYVNYDTIKEHYESL